MRAEDYNHFPDKKKVNIASLQNHCIMRLMNGWNAISAGRNIESKKEARPTTSVRKLIADYYTDRTENPGRSMSALAIYESVIILKKVA